MPAAGELIRDLRARHRLGQEQLARRAATSQAQISRIERGETSPSIATLSRLLACVGEELRLDAQGLSTGNRDIAELREDYERLTPAERFAEAAELSSVLTELAARRTRR
ncbi:MAG TPA: helix-turn-helix transcriptional regulator [Thermoleophilaceae bacterium]|nr:helix-turn-helix transcriptional regulator [Thermoleophilaceae bacterium]